VGLGREPRGIGVDRLPRGAHPAYPRWFGGVGGKLPPFVWRQEPPPATALQEARVAVLFCSRFNILKQMMPNFNRRYFAYPNTSTPRRADSPPARAKPAKETASGAANRSRSSSSSGCSYVRRAVAAGTAAGLDNGVGLIAFGRRSCGG
jgi:hypothetical protein